jgi:formylglycine-generating enzyme required for sulfatase activity
VGYGREQKTLHLQLQVHPFYIARYPITYVQFQAFLDDKDMGFDHDEWWLGLTPEFQKQEMYEQLYKYDNHPRDTVTWYQAVAFCRWLTARLPPDAWPSGNILVGDDCVIRLPTEWEWQQAVTGGRSDYTYPWGKEWDGRRANIQTSGIGLTTAVGMYPAGASPAPVEALDMIGNVMEWCLNEYKNPANVNIAGDAWRVKRSSSFIEHPYFSRALLRHRSFETHPGSVEHYFGFRVAVGAVPDGSGL